MYRLNIRRIDAVAMRMQVSILQMYRLNIRRIDAVAMRMQVSILQMYRLNIIGEITGHDVEIGFNTSNVSVELECYANFYNTCYKFQYFKCIG